MSAGKLFNRLLRVIILIFLFAQTSLADNPQTVAQTQTKIKQLDQQINTLKQTLEKAADKKGLLTQELAKNEKEIATTAGKLQVIQRELTIKQQKVNTLKQHINELNQKLTNEQKLLVEHLRVRYKMGEYQPIKWIINQNDLFSMSRLLTYHQYLASSRQQMINKIATMQKYLADNHAILKTEIEGKRTLREKVHAAQETLKRNQKNHAIIMQSLTSDIQNKQQVLLEYERNKENLSRLLKTLTSQSNLYIQPKHPFVQMRHKLRRPVQTDKAKAQKMNQGITFFASEGAPVYAIYPGKVVFSDWLNGYGLLVIIDHGQGYMTLYAHNESLYKKTGTAVYQGEQIAAVGHTGGIKQNGLYFEIRRHGKAIPPLDWLS
ncbi:peptidase, M23/M37 family [Legionella beliardensis]|uniref:Peptidase, M23/M37 family n=1 Tax=Legionella beliardensis TaxID=91822 RepID=A0A378I081_9GAMM|nr:peptidoglycan DD-metalloendopeptidase family protein [Legionella beliardensis]STX28055.1 peptidase, M23/M37 family [Legionella beliardensis]